ncbi:hypothetical protein SOVF_158860 [Spinacia oleracea]|nr:hypothetical protein SOVF_158860 [Spinacia oleracea]
MAESIVSDLVKTILEKLGSEAYKKFMYAKDLDSHIHTLQDLKTTIEATLVDADSLESCTTTLAELDRFLEEQLDKAELKQVKRGNKFIKQLRLFFPPFKDVGRLRAIIEKLDCIARNHANFGSIAMISSSVDQMNGRRRSIQNMVSSSILNNLVVGRDEDRDKLVNMLSD